MMSDVFMISVIVPVYQAEKYLPACLESFEQQNFKDYELLLIDDGSTDRSGEICDQYAEKHAHVRVVHQKNRGISAVRNEGLALAKGRYIVFADADDVAAPDYLSYLYDLAVCHDADVAVANNRQFKSAKPPAAAKEDVSEYVIDSAEAIELLCYGKLGVYAWGKIYRREVLEGIVYPEGKIYEDVATTYRVLAKAQRIACSTHCVYFWRQQKDSITHRKITWEHWAGVDAVKEMEDFIRVQYPQILPAVQYRYAARLVVTAHRLVISGGEKEIFRCAQKEMRAYICALWRNTHCGWSLKVRALLLCLGYFPFSTAAKVYEKIR